MNKRAIYKAAFTVSGLVLIALASAWATKDTAQTRAESQQATYSEKLINFPSGTKIAVNFIADQKTYSYTTLVSDDQVTVEDQTSKTISAAHDLYLLHSTAEISEGNYIDIELQIDKKANRVSASLSNSPLEKTVYIAVDGNNHSNSIPVDWAGQLNLLVQLENEELAGNDICLVIEELVDNQTAQLCHHIANSEGQVPS